VTESLSILRANDYDAVQNSLKTQDECLDWRKLTLNRLSPETLITADALRFLQFSFQKSVDQIWIPDERSGNRHKFAFLFSHQLFHFFETSISSNDRQIDARVRPPHNFRVRLRVSLRIRKVGVNLTEKIFPILNFIWCSISEGSSLL
jgi:hypothetical protein